MVYRKRKAPIISDDNMLISPKKRRIIRMQKISSRTGRKRSSDDSNLENKRKRQRINIDVTHAYLSLNHGMVSYPVDYIQHQKETYEKRSYTGLPEHICKHCNACFWFHERNITDSRKKKEIIYSNCCKYGQIKIPPFKEPPEFLCRLNKQQA